MAFQPLPPRLTCLGCPPAAPLPGHQGSGGQHPHHPYPCLGDEEDGSHTAATQEGPRGPTGASMAGAPSGASGSAAAACGGLWIPPIIRTCTGGERAVTTKTLGSHDGGFGHQGTSLDGDGWVFPGNCSPSGPLPSFHCDRRAEMTPHRSFSKHQPMGGGRPALSRQVARRCHLGRGRQGWSS